MNVKRVFSPRAFGLALALAVGGVVVGGAVPVVGVVGRYVGLLLAGLGVGLVLGGRRYLEVGLAGALAAGTGFLLSTLSALPMAAALADQTGVALAGVGVGTGVVCALAGHYFGRDLRAGVTRELG
ncbi:MAG: hypothetical protein ABEJ79_04670 [Halolamina sp.]